MQKTASGKLSWMSQVAILQLSGCHNPVEFQRCQHEVLKGLRGVHVIADDILIIGQGETEEEPLQEHGRKQHRLS